MWDGDQNLKIKDWRWELEDGTRDDDTLIFYIISSFLRDRLKTLPEDLRKLWFVLGRFLSEIVLKPPEKGVINTF